MRKYVTPTSQDDHPCINCQEPVNNLYCQHCGQRQDIKRITWTSVFGDLQSRFLGFDNSFLRTVKDLTIRPGKVVQTILKGVRVKYVGPAGYFFVLISIFILLLALLKIDPIEFLFGFMDSYYIDADKSKSHLDDPFIGFLSENFKLSFFLVLPAYVFASWLIFRKSGLNFTEHAVTILYAYAHPLILSIFSLFIYKVKGHSFDVLINVISIIYIGFLLSDVHTYNKRWWAFFKGVLVWVFGLLLVVVVTVIVVVIIKAVSSV